MTDEQGVHEAKDAINAEAYAMPMSTKTNSKKSRTSTPRGSLEDDNPSRCGRPRKFAGGAKPTAVTFLGPTPWRTSRYRTSELLTRQIAQGISVNPLCLFSWVFDRTHFASSVALDGLGHDVGRDWKFVF